MRIAVSLEFIASGRAGTDDTASISLTLLSQLEKLIPFCTIFVNGQTITDGADE